MTDSKIIYTLTDEAPLLATYAFLPVISSYASTAGVAVETRDISLAGRIIASFPEYLDADKRIGDHLAELGALTLRPEANIIKLPNISASIPQMKAAIAELQDQGYEVPDYPEDPQTDQEKEIRARYDRVKGSAVNPVLREGNSDRRAPLSVKQYARKHPHSMGAWTPDSRTNVAHMDEGDFRHTEKSIVMDRDDTLRIEFVGDDGSTRTLKEGVPVLNGEIVDGATMSAEALSKFLSEQVERAKSEGVLFSLHLKATMMKVSDPIIFGHGVRAYFPKVFDEYGDALASVGGDPDDGLGSVLQAAQDFPADERMGIEAAVRDAMENGPPLAMVDSDLGITNLHVPSDVIVDASMPAMIRTSGHMYGPDGKEADTLAVIPDSSYAGIYQVVLDDCRKNGAYDPATMGSVPNVGLMAQAAEEYGSHDKTFEVPAAGTVRVIDTAGNTVMEHKVGAGDIYRMCQTKDIPVQDWVKLAVTRARLSGAPAIFWLDETRPHDAKLIAKMKAYLPDYDTSGLHIDIMSPDDAIAFSLERIRKGEDTISVTGNVLRDYLTDLFPIMELGTSAKMLSIVPLIAGGGMFETGPVALPRSTCSSWCVRTTCDGTAWASTWHSPRASSTWPRPRATNAPRSWPTRWTEPRRPSWTRTSRPAAGSTRSTIAAATSTSRSSGPRSWPHRSRTRTSPERSRCSRVTCARRSPSSPKSSCRSRARRSTSVATTTRTRRRRPPSCGPRRR